MSPVKKVLASIATLATLGLGAFMQVTAASASVNTPGIVYSHEEAGFQASSLPGDKAPWHYRYVQAQVTLPDVTSNTDKAVMPGGYGVSVRLTDAAETAVLGISTTPGSGSYNAAFAVELADGTSLIASCTNGNSPAWSAGDTVLFNLYYNTANGNVQYNATDKTANSVFAGTCSQPGQNWTSAQIGDEFATDAYGSPSNFAAPKSGNFRLDEFTNTVVTNFSGEHGSAGSAPWPVQRLTMIADGTGKGAVDASTPFAWGAYAAPVDNVVRDGRNFSVWLPAYPS